MEVPSPPERQRNQKLTSTLLEESDADDEPKFLARSRLSWNERYKKPEQNTTKKDILENSKDKEHPHVLSEGQQLTRLIQWVCNLPFSICFTYFLMKSFSENNFLHSCLDDPETSYLAGFLFRLKVFCEGKDFASLKASASDLFSQGYTWESVDHFPMQLVAADLTGFMFASTICLILDLVLPTKTRSQMQAQGSKAKPFTKQEFWDALSTSLWNLTVLSLLGGMPTFWVRFPFSVHGKNTSWRDAMKEKWFNETREGNLASNFPLFPDIPVAILLHTIVVEAVFYWTHRMLHLKPFYARIHKMHHKFHITTAVACVHSHWIEFLIGNLPGIILGPYCSNCHPTLGVWWVMFTLIDTAGAHSGYCCFKAKGHDLHHEFFNVNYGVLNQSQFGFDRLCGTRYEDSVKRSKRNEEVEAEHNLERVHTLSLSYFGA